MSIETKEFWSQCRSLLHTLVETAMSTVGCGSVCQLRLFIVISESWIYHFNLFTVISESWNLVSQTLFGIPVLVTSCAVTSDHQSLKDTQHFHSSKKVYNQWGNSIMCLPSSVQSFQGRSNVSCFACSRLVRDRSVTVGKTWPNSACLCLPSFAVMTLVAHWHIVLREAEVFNRCCSGALHSQTSGLHCTS